MEKYFQKQIKELVSVIKSVEWISSVDDGVVAEHCQMCYAWREDGHFDGCRLAAALRDTEENDYLEYQQFTQDLRNGG